MATNNKNDTRTCSYEILIAILERKQSLDEAFGRFSRDLPTRDRAYVRALITLTLRHKTEIDAIIDACLKRPLPKTVERVRYILALGIAQTLYMVTADHAAVSTIVDLAKSKGFEKQSGLVNAVLRRTLRNPNDFKEARNAGNAPEWLLSEWKQDYGTKTLNAILQAHKVEPPLDITLRDQREADSWAKQLNATILANGSLRRSSSGSVKDLPGYDEGAWWVQDAAAALPATLFGNIKGKNIADICAAPGGKTLQLAANGALVTAIDRSANRLKRLQENLDRTGLSAEVITADATKWQPNKEFDALLIDAPCSATGTVRRHPDLLWTKSSNDVAALHKVQQKILNRAHLFLKPGGLLVYCTCSLQKVEQTASPYCVPTGLVFDPIQTEELGEWGFVVTSDGTMRTLPSHLPECGGMDGFYVARFKKPLD